MIGYYIFFISLLVYRFKSFFYNQIANMPKLKDKDMIIERDSAIDTFHFPPVPNWLSSSRQQDRLFYQDKILYISEQGVIDCIDLIHNGCKVA